MGLITGVSTQHALNIRYLSLKVKGPACTGVLKGKPACVRLIMKVLASIGLILEGPACIKLEMEDPASIGFKKQIIFEKITLSVFGREFLRLFDLDTSHEN
jgi:hypothetical protein